jgi:hypothetical protein
VSIEIKLPESVQCRWPAAFAWLGPGSISIRICGEPVSSSVMTAFAVKKYGCEGDTFVHELVD